MPAVEQRAANQPGTPGVAPAAVPDAPTVLYDGVCGLCARSVRWILRHERDHELVFAPLQGPTADAMRARWPEIPATIDTVVFVDRDRVHLRSKAFFHLASHLRAPWRWMHALRRVPGFLPDIGYRLIAAVRYRVWGKADVCERSE
ncbi:MAG: thiol-disulfide oxidoreductase DCC family protein, partial [Kofleriaceae bacterium]